MPETADREGVVDIMTGELTPAPTLLGAPVAPDLDGIVVGIIRTGAGAGACEDEEDGRGGRGRP